jgi:hypothetical protein
VNSIEAVSLEILSAPSASPVDASVLPLGTEAAALAVGPAELLVVADALCAVGTLLTAALALLAAEDATLGLALEVVLALATATLADALPEGKVLVGVGAVRPPVAGALGAVVEVGDTPELAVDTPADAEASGGAGVPRFSLLQPNPMLRHRATLGRRRECSDTRMQALMCSLLTY